MDIKQKLIDEGYDENDVKKFVSYLSDEKIRGTELPPGHKLHNLFVKYHKLGLVIDGTNVVLAGQNMAMITYHGYMNKILQSYPESEIDVQLVREGDDFKVTKESGAILYTHNIGDPFGNSEIIGAYAVVKNKRGEKLETLNKSDFEKMKNSSRNKATWDKWESEFWLKSVIKRICKRYFYDIVGDIDKIDNDDFGAEDIGSTVEKKDGIVNAHKKNTLLQPRAKKRGVV